MEKQVSSRSYCHLTSLLLPGTPHFQRALLLLLLIPFIKHEEPASTPCSWHSAQAAPLQSPGCLQHLFLQPRPCWTQPRSPAAPPSLLPAWHRCGLGKPIRSRFIHPAPGGVAGGCTNTAKLPTCRHKHDEPRQEMNEVAFCLLGFGAFLFPHTHTFFFFFFPVNV